MSGGVGSTASASWLVWALGSAGFAAMTAIFAKIGVLGEVDQQFGGNYLNETTVSPAFHFGLLVARS